MNAAVPTSHSATALGEYLRARRSLVQPESVGLQRARNRRVPGLRREEVAKLASISPEYYLRLEQGNDREPSDQVLRGIAKALLLDENAEQHLRRLRRLRRLAAWIGGTPVEHDTTVPEPLAHLLAQWRRTPAFVMSGSLDLLLVNSAADELGDRRLQQGLNLVEFAFSAEGRRDEVGWEARAARSTAALRYHGDPYDRRFQQLVGRLSIRDEDFRRLWARHDARPMQFGRVRIDAGSNGPAHASFHTFEVQGHEQVLLTVIEEG